MENSMQRITLSSRRADEPSAPVVLRVEHRGYVGMTAMHGRSFGGGSAASASSTAAASRKSLTWPRAWPTSVRRAAFPRWAEDPHGLQGRSSALRRGTAELLAEHMREVLAEDDSGIFGPDMHCGDEVLDRLAGEPDLAAHVTGLSASRAGLDINRQAFTARGVVHALDTYVDACARPVRTATVQGFGMVGAPVARALPERGIAVRAVSNRFGVLRCDAGLDVERLFQSWLELGDDCLPQYADLAPSGTAFDPIPTACSASRRSSSSPPRAPPCWPCRPRSAIAGVRIQTSARSRTSWRARAAGWCCRPRTTR